MFVLPPKQYVASIDVDAQNNPEVSASVSKNIAKALNEQAQRAGMRIGSKNSAHQPLLDTLPSPTDYTYFVWKSIDKDIANPGICYYDAKNKLSTGLIEYLQAFRIQCVILGGLTLEKDVIASAIQLRNQGFEVIINLSACHSLNEDKMKQVTKQCKAYQIRTIQSLDELKTNR